jgi:hypothetical protein
VIRIEGGLLFLVQSCNGIRHEIDIDDVNLIVGTKWQGRQPCQENECLDHIELGGFGAPAVPKDDAWTKNRLGGIGQQHPCHVFAEFLGARVGIVIGTIPLDGMIFGDNLVLSLTGDSHRADLAEPAQAMVMLRVPRQGEDLQSAP